jgi:hypothetical protein
LVEVRHTAKTQAVVNRRKDIANNQELHVGPKVVSCGGKPKEIAMADILKGIKETCTILGYADDWVIVTSSKEPIRAVTRLKETANGEMDKQQRL